MASLIKESRTDDHVVIEYSSYNIVVAAVNCGGTIALSGLTDTSYVRMKAKIEEC